MTVQMPERITIQNADEFGQGLINKCRSAEAGEVVELDFSQLSMLCSTGLGKILKAHQICKDRAVKIKITDVADNYIRKMLSMIHMGKVVEIE